MSSMEVVYCGSQGLPLSDKYRCSARTLKRGGFFQSSNSGQSNSIQKEKNKVENNDFVRTEKGAKAVARHSDRREKTGNVCWAQKKTREFPFEAIKRPCVCAVVPRCSFGRGCGSWQQTRKGVVVSWLSSLSLAHPNRF